MNKKNLLLQVKNLNGFRGERLLFKNLHLDLHAGEIVQIVGKNGIGKSSLLKMLVGLLPFCEGEMDWKLGSPDLFYLGHDQAIKRELTVYENLQCDLRTCHAKRAEILSALNVMEINELAFIRCAELSQGQRQRVALAKLLLSKASVWILDEPFASLDQDTSEKMSHLFLEKINKGGAIILTSHQALTLDFPVRVLTL